MSEPPKGVIKTLCQVAEFPHLLLISIYLLSFRYVIKSCVYIFVSFKLSTVFIWERKKEGRKEEEDGEEVGSLPLKIGANIGLGAAVFLKTWFHFRKPEYLMNGLTHAEDRFSDKTLLGAVLKNGVYF